MITLRASRSVTVPVAFTSRSYANYIVGGADRVKPSMQNGSRAAGARSLASVAMPRRRRGVGGAIGTGRCGAGDRGSPVGVPERRWALVLGVAHGLPCRPW